MKSISGPVKMLAIEEDRKVPDRKLFGKVLSRFNASLDPPFPHSEHAARRLAIKPAGHSCQMHFRRLPLLVKHSARHAAPETPFSEIPLGQSFLGDLVMNNLV